VPLLLLLRSLLLPLLLFLAICLRLFRFSDFPTRCARVGVRVRARVPLCVRARVWWRKSFPEWSCSWISISVCSWILDTGSWSWTTSRCALCWRCERWLPEPVFEPGQDVGWKTDSRRRPSRMRAWKFGFSFLSLPFLSKLLEVCGREYCCACVAFVYIFEGFARWLLRLKGCLSAEKNQR